MSRWYWIGLDIGHCKFDIGHWTTVLPWCFLHLSVCATLHYSVLLTIVKHGQIVSVSVCLCNSYFLFRTYSYSAPAIMFFKNYIYLPVFDVAIYWPGIFCIHFFQNKNFKFYRLLVSTHWCPSLISLLKFLTAKDLVCLMILGLSMLHLSPPRRPL